jgi:hypothetical protein
MLAGVDKWSVAFSSLWSPLTLVEVHWLPAEVRNTQFELDLQITYNSRASSAVFCSVQVGTDLGPYQTIMNINN